MGAPSHRLLPLRRGLPAGYNKRGAQIARFISFWRLGNFDHLRVDSDFEYRERKLIPSRPVDAIDKSGLGIVLKPQWPRPLGLQGAQLDR